MRGSTSGFRVEASPSTLNALVEGLLTPPRALRPPAVSGYPRRPARGLKTPCRGHQEGVKGS